jgi:alpha-aminoadipate/glutamate carrier protein LysW
MTDNRLECSECGAELSLPADIIRGEILLCADCGVELEVVSLDPPTIDLAPRTMEDRGE